VYCSNNQVWNQAGGYALFSTDYRPDADWDNTTRNWFTGAKKNAPNISFADPYVDVVTNKITTAISINVYNQAGEDVGIVSGNVSVGFLDAMLSENAVMPGQQTYFLNKQGLFITHSDADAVLVRDFFTESGLERYRDVVLSSESYFNVDNEIFIYAVAIPEVDWILVSTIPASVVFAGTNQFMINLVSVNMVLIILALALAFSLTGVLRQEREENAAMKDNPRIGFFLMDRKYRLKEQYSGVLEEMLSTTNLKGRNFVDLLGASLHEQQREILKQYFDMVSNHSFDQEMLDDLNPLRELSYTSVETGEQKVLSCDFAAVEWGKGKGKMFILGNIHDITAEKELQKRLKAEESRRQEEMRSLFEVIQVDPSVFFDFIEDAEFECNQIQAFLRDKSRPPQDVVVDVYQSVHAIKSNAIILGLNDFGNKVHELETRIKELREQTTITLEDMIDLSRRLDQIRQEKDKFRTILDKILAFTVKEGRKKHEYVLIETLSQAIQKTSGDLGKKVRLVADTIDTGIIASGHRRLIKEVLMQLVRNAVYHGIENPEERLAGGKAETGTIYLAINMEAGKIHLILQDDGRGINFDKIRQKALKSGLIRSRAQAADKGFLVRLIFSPEFTTAENEGIHAGRGIGLSLVRDRIHGVRGSIKVQTQPGKGTVFHVYIPSKL
jgi:two-component system chemotaxis sensor kinase CheA